MYISSALVTCVVLVLLILPNFGINIVLDSFLEADPALVLECHAFERAKGQTMLERQINYLQKHTSLEDRKIKLA